MKIDFTHTIFAKKGTRAAFVEEEINNQIADEISRIKESEVFDMLFYVIPGKGEMVAHTISHGCPVRSLSDFSTSAVRLPSAILRRMEKAALEALANNGLAYDGLPLFSAQRRQPNLFSSTFNDLEVVIDKLSKRIEQFEAEGGGKLGYTGDIIIIPANRWNLAKRLINLLSSYSKYSRFSLVQLAEWNADEDRIMLLSSVANRDLLGNSVLLGKNPKITHTYNAKKRKFIWTATAKTSVRFNSHKHIVQAVEGLKDVEVIG